MNLLDVYRSILGAAAMIADDEGYVSFNNKLYSDLPAAPVMIGEKRLVLPTTEHLRNPSSARIMFHPLREQAMQGESEVVAKLRLALGLRLNFTFAGLINECIMICKNIPDHKHLNPDQTTLVSIGQNVTEDTHIAFTELLKRTESQLAPNKSFISIYVKKNALLHGTNYHRAGVVTFPVYEELVKEEEKPFGMTISKRERKNLIALMEYILPDIGKEHAYDRGSNSGVAPYLEGLMRVFGAVGSRLNDKYELFEEIIKVPELKIESAWEEAFEDLDKLLPEIQMVPTQPGNEGRQPVADKKTTSLSPQSLQAALAPTPVAAPVAAAVPVNTGYNQPQVAQPAQPAQPALEHTGNGVTWRSAAAAIGLPPANGAYYQPGMPMVMHNPAAPRSGDWNSHFAPATYQPGQMGYPQQGYPQQGYGNNGYPPVYNGYNPGMSRI